MIAWASASDGWYTGNTPSRTRAVSPIYCRSGWELCKAQEIAGTTFVGSRFSFVEIVAEHVDMGSTGNVHTLIVTISETSRYTITVIDTVRHVKMTLLFEAFAKPKQPVQLTADPMVCTGLKTRVLLEPVTKVMPVDVSERQACRDLATMEKLGLLRVEGADVSTTYMRTNRT